ncbi:MAG: hypothetical protein GEU90_19820 [Gemmatimonas sp.]|nr:hypothetical protein [Gemmatimonas sp.]
MTIGALVLYLQNLYTAVEQLLTRVASEIDGKVPSGDNWHRELLDQLNMEISGIRPAVLDAELYADLDLLRRFRHRVRHAYAAEYDWAEMQNILAAAEALRVRLLRTLADFDAWLQRTIERLRQPSADPDDIK